MKIVFFLLLLANLTVLLYERHPARSPTVDAIPTEALGAYREQIVLAQEQPLSPLIEVISASTANAPASTDNISASAENVSASTATPSTPTEELSASNEPPSTSAEAPPAPPKALEPEPDAQQPLAMLTCYEAGPFARQSQLASWSQALQGISYSLQTAHRQSTETFGYLLVYPTSGNQLAVASALEYLNSLGIDGQPLRAGEYKGAISLAALDTKQRIQAAQREMTAIGIKSVIKPRTRNRTQFYALFTITDAENERWQSIRQQSQKIPIRPMPDDEPFCKESLSRLRASDSDDKAVTAP